MGTVDSARADCRSIRERVDLVEVAGRYLVLRKSGTEHEALCPFHGDHAPSLTIYRGRDGIQRFKCFSCGAQGDALDFICKLLQVALPKAMKILAGESFPVRDRQAPHPIAPVWRPILPVPRDAPSMDARRLYNPKRSAWLAVHALRTDAYRGPSGELLGYVLRAEMRDGRKWTPTITWAHGPAGAACWALVAFPEPRPLQGLDALAKRPNDRVLIVSGEKCRAAAAATLSAFVAVTWPGGDNAVRKADWTPLRGRDCTFWPDADDSGIAAMNLAAELAMPGRCRVLDVCELGATFGKGADIADLVDTGWGEELIMAWGGLDGR